MNKSIIILFSFVLASCGSSYIDKAPDIPKSDTSFTVVAYSYDWSHNDHRITTAKKVIKDSFELQKADTTKDGIVQKRVWIKDTFYLVPFMDSVTLSDSMHKPLLDSLKRPKKKYDIKWVVLPKELLLQDYNKNFK